MIELKDRDWLKKTFEECFTEEVSTKNDRKLEGFSILVRNIVRNIEQQLEETQKLWECNPLSEELKNKFDSLKKCLLYLEKYSREKIGREILKNKIL